MLVDLTNHDLILCAPARLGNVLGGHSVFYHLANRTGARVQFPTFREFAHMFSSTRDNPFFAFDRPSIEPRWRPPDIDAHELLRLIVQHIQGQFAGRRSLDFITIIPGTLGLIDGAAPTRRDILARDYVEFIEGHRTIVVYRPFGFVHSSFLKNSVTLDEVHEFRKLVQIEKSLLDRARAQLRPLRHRRGVILGLHIRRTDYAKWKDGQFYFDWADYRRALDRLLSDHAIDHPGLVVCSDDSVPVEFLEGFDYEIGPGQVEVDFALLSDADYVVGPPSTFADWAAFCGGGKRFLIASPAQVIGPIDLLASPTDSMPSVRFMRSLTIQSQKMSLARA